MTNDLRAVRAELSSGLESNLAELARLSGPKRILELGFFVFCELVGLFLMSRSPEILSLGYVTGALLSVTALNAFVLLLHEGMHHTLFKSRALNELGSVLLGSTVGISYTAYRIMHLRHHEYLGDEQDPDDYHNYTDSPRRVWLMHGLRVVMGSLLYLFLIPFQAWRHADTKERGRLVAEYAWLSALAASIACRLPFSTWAHYHGIPLLFVGWLVNLRGFTQHGLAVAEDPYLASRSVHAKAWLRFLLLNENYHLEHHLFPEVPSYHLHALHKLLWPRLPRAVKNDSYSEFLWATLKAAPHLDESPIGIVERPTEEDPR